MAGLFAVGFDGTTPSPEIVELIRRGVYGVILFSRNITDARQVAGLVSELKRIAGRPFLVSVDQEGGRVARLRAPQGFTELPPMRAVGASGDERLAFEVGALLGRELRSVGIDHDYAPVVDVDTNPANPVIGDRSFARSADVVGRMGAALARGLQAEGVAACAKHFPGHGDTSQDSHKDLPRLPHSMERLREVELVPFRALAQADVASVMTAHVVFEALDPVRPATLSRPSLDLLRRECRYDGCIISDNLEMAAVAQHFPLEESVPAAVDAGVDALLVCQHAEVQHRAIDVLRSAVERGEVSPERLAEARRHVEGLLRWAGPAPDPARAQDRLRTDAHLRLAARIPTLRDRKRSDRGVMPLFYSLSKSLAWVANPAAWGLLLVLAAVLVGRRPAWAAALAMLGALQLVAFSSPRFVDAVQDRLERSAPLTYRPDRRYDAAVVLGGGDDRILGGAEVVRSGRGRALLYTGEMTTGEATALVRELRSRGLDDAQIVIGDRARNTYENAVEAAQIVAQHGWQSLLVVTSAVHMPRALACFHRQGLEPDVLPVDAARPRPRRGWRPTSAALEQSRALLHEVIGRIVYKAVGYST